MELFKIDLLNSKDFILMVIKFFMNLSMVYAIVHSLYRGKKHSFTFTYYTLSVLVFFLCFLLGSVKLELGFALGLFAIFSIIRYRTLLISIKEMTYLFVVIGVAVFNSLASAKISWAELVFANLAILAIMYLRERVVHSEIKEYSIKYDNVNLLHSDKREELFRDIESRLGVKVVSVEIGNIDYIKDSVELTVFYT